MRLTDIRTCLPHFFLGGTIMGIVFLEAYLFLGHALLAAFCGALVALMVEYHLLMEIRSLRARVASPHPNVWHAAVNGVEIGYVTDLQHARLCLSVYENPRTYLRQAGNVVWASVRALDFAAVRLPIVVLLAVAALALWSPTSVDTIIYQLQRATPAEVAAGIRASAAAIGPLLVGIIFVASNFGIRFGCRSVFDDGIQEAIRTHLSCYAKGELVCEKDMGCEQENAADRSDAPVHVAVVGRSVE